MRRPMLRVIVTFLAVLIAASVPALPAKSSPPSIIEDVRALEAWRAGEQAKLAARGGATQADFARLDEQFLEKARSLEPKRAAVIEDLQRRSKVANLGQGAGGTAPELGRGLQGDIDSRALQGKEFDRVVRAARDMGYKPVPKGDAVTIKELNVTFHREPTRYASPVGSSAAEAERGRGFNKETDPNFGKSPKASSPAGRPDPNVAVMKNREKGAGALGKTPQQLLRSPSDMQELGKMTLRNMESAGLRNPALERQVDMLKRGYSPEAAGIVPPGGGAADKAKAMSRFQSQVREVNLQAARATQAAADKTLAGLRDAAGRAEAALAQARKGGNAEALARANRELIGAKSELIEFAGQQQAARQSLIRNNAAGTRVLAESQGLGARLVNTPNGPRWQTAEGLKTPSQMADALSKPPGQAAPSAGLGKKLLGLGMLGLMVHGGYVGLKEGARQAGLEADASGDSSLTSATKTAAYGVWHGLGFGAAKAIGEQAGLESAEQYARDVAEGKIDPESRLSAAWAGIRGVGWGVAKFTGLQDIKDAIVRLGDAPGALQARAEQYEAEKRLEEQKADDARRNAERAARAKKKEEEGKETAAGTTTGSKPAPTSSAKTFRKAEPADEPEEKTEVLPNLVRTSWQGEITFQVEGGPAQVFVLRIAIDSYNTITGTTQWIPWFDESDSPKPREVPVTGKYDGKTGRFAVSFDKGFSVESKTTQVFSIPLEGGGTKQETHTVVEQKLDRIRGRIEGSIVSPDAASGNVSVTDDSSIVVNGKTEGGGSTNLSGTWRLVRTK